MFQSKNIEFGFSFIMKKAPIPTQTRDKLAKRVDIEAFDSIMDVFQSAILQANNRSQIIATITPFRSVIGFLK